MRGLKGQRAGYRKRHPPFKVNFLRDRVTDGL